MKVTLTASGGRPFELAGHGDTSPDNLRINGDLVSEVAEYLRADTVEVFNRGNRRTTVAFRVTREHATVEAAQLYLLKHETTLPRQGILEFEAEQGRARTWIHDALLTQVAGSHQGASTFHEYQFLGGEMSSVSPFQRSSLFGGS